MATKTFFEKRIIKEIHDLPESALATIEKVIRLLKQEIYSHQTTPDQSTKRLLSLCGSWEDSRSVEEQIRDVYDSRKSVENRERLKLSDQNLV